jgi:1-acyl-sn-glycerol-3-phosphate acyltransferase
MPRFLQRSFSAAYGVYVLVLFGALALLATLLVALMPALEARRAAAKYAARLTFLLAGIPLEVSNTDSIPAGTCVVVANHASYLDGIVLTAALPANFGFVIKQEIRRVPVAHLLLRRLGSHFVERNNRNRGAVDARRILRAAHAGQALAFFPEGTFDHEPGLRPFRTGAFATAVRAQLPLIPVAITGARDILPAGAWLPRPGRLSVTVLSTLHPDPAADNPVIDLKDRARAVLSEAVAGTVPRPARAA